jgi:hypothetical protein
LKVLHRSMVYIETATSPNGHFPRTFPAAGNSVFCGHFVAHEEATTQSEDVLLY